MCLFAALGLGCALAGSWIYINRLTLTLPMPENPRTVAYRAPQTERVSPLLVQYRVDVPGRGEVFPALASAAATDYWPFAILTISNTASRAIVEVVRAEVPEWSRPFEQTVVVGPHATMALKITPDLLPAAYTNHEIVHAMLHISVMDESGGTSFAQSHPVLIHSGSDLYWGKQFANVQVVARWVTPHDPAVLNLVSEAKQFVPNGRMPGYNAAEREAQATMSAQVTRQAEAVFKAIQRSGFSYVSSIYTFGGFTDVAQRIRLPRETLQLDTANCMDISVTFASAIENLDMKPVLVIVPGHAFAGVRLGPETSDILYVDLTVLPQGTFQQAVARAQQWMKKTPPEEVLTVDVSSARRMGIYPLPGSAEAKTPTVRAAD